MFARNAGIRAAFIPSSVCQCATSTTRSAFVHRFEGRSVTRVKRRNMATSSKIHLTGNEDVAFALKGLSSQSADTASELLQENHEKHHIFFNQSGFHVSICSAALFPAFTSRCMKSSKLTTSTESHSPPSPHHLRAERLARRT